MNEIIKKNYIYIVLLICFIFGLATSKDYGNYFDQESEINILYSNVKAYSEAIPFVKKQTNDFFEINEAIYPIGQTTEQDHGVAVYLPLFLILQNHCVDGEFVNTAQHIYSFVLFFVGILSLFYLTKKIAKSKFFAMIAAMLYYFTPRFFAEGHYNNKDVMLLSLMLMVFAVGFACVEKPTIFRCVLFAFLGALATNVKIVGIIAPGIMGLIYIIRTFKEKGKIKRIRIYKAIMVIALVIFFYWLFTPAMWMRKREYFTYIYNNAVLFSRWDGFILFNGKIYKHSVTGLPTQYVIVQYLITTPVFVSLFAFVGLILLWIDAFRIKSAKLFWKDEGNLLIFLGTMSSIMFMLYAMFSKMVLYNSWRHLYFCNIGILFATIYLFKKIKEKEKFKKMTKFIFSSVLGLYFGVIITGIAMNHPYQYAYMNILAGENVEERYEIDYWCVSMSNALSELCEMVPDETIAILGLERCTDGRLSAAISILPEEKKERFVQYRLDVTIEKGMYVIENPTYADMHAPEEYRIVRATSDKIVDIEAYGNSIMRIYQMK